MWEGRRLLYRLGIGIWSVQLTTYFSLHPSAFIKLSASIPIHIRAELFHLGCRCRCCCCCEKYADQVKCSGGVYFLDQWFRKLIPRPDLIDANAFPCFYYPPPHSPVTCSSLLLVWVNTFLVPFIKHQHECFRTIYTAQPPPIGKRLGITLWSFSCASRFSRVVFARGGI